MGSEATTAMDKSNTITGEVAAAWDAAFKSAGLATGIQTAKDVTEAIGSYAVRSAIGVLSGLATGSPATVPVRATRAAWAGNRSMSASTTPRGWR